MSVVYLVMPKIARLYGICGAGGNWALSLDLYTIISFFASHYRQLKYMYNVQTSKLSLSDVLVYNKHTFTSESVQHV